MKIVILTQYFLPETGAPQSRLYETVMGLQQRGWEVMVVTAMPNYPTGSIFKAYRNKLFISDKVNDIDVRRYILYPSNSPEKIPRILSMVSFSITSFFSMGAILKFKPDYIFTESPPLTLSLTGLLLSKLSRAKHVMNVSDLWPLSAYRLGALSKGFLYDRLEGLEKYLYKHSYACTGQSQEIVDHIAARGNQRTFLYRNGVNVDRFKDLPVKNADAKPKIVYTGLLGVAQGILELCRNVDFKSLGVEFHIYGDGGEKNAVELYLLENPDEQIFLHKLVSRDEVPAILVQHNFALIPLTRSIQGAVPSKIYEAMAAGLPIIFTGGGEGAKLITDHNLGWVCDPGDYEKMSDCIKSVLLMNDTDISMIKENCKVAAANIFNREYQIDGLHQFLSTAQ